MRRTDYTMNVDFKYPGDDNTYEVIVNIPVSIFCEVFKSWFLSARSLLIEGTDGSIQELASSLCDIEDIVSDDYFWESCKDLYFKSSAYEEDYKEWKEEYEYDNDIIN